MKMRLRRYIYHLALNVIAQNSLCPVSIRKCLYNMFGHKIRGKVGIGSFIGYTSCKKLIIGGGSFTNVRCFFDMSDNIEIGRNCCISYNVTFATGSHEIGTTSKRGGNGITAPIKVNDGCWIGCNVVLLPGVTIGRGCIIGAGSLVTKDCEPNSIYVGSPARLIRKLDG